MICVKIYFNSDENTHKYFNLKCNLNIIREINKRNMNLQGINNEQNKKLDELEPKIEMHQKLFNESDNIISKLKSQLNDLQKSKYIDEKLIYYKSKYILIKILYLLLFINLSLFNK